MLKRTFFVFLILAVFAATPALATPKVGELAPDFSVVDTNGKTRTLSALKGQVVVLEWKNHECPYVGKHYGSGNMQTQQQYATGKGATWISIISSAPGKQGYVSRSQANQIAVDEKSHATGIILDPEGRIGRLYEAKTTPHMFVIGKDGAIAYMGAIDDTPSTDANDVQKARSYVREAVDAASDGKSPEVAVTNPYGCGVKY